MRLDLCVYNSRDIIRNFWVIKITFHFPPLHTHVRRSGLGPTLSMESCVTLGKLPPQELFVHISYPFVKNSIQSFHVDIRLSLCWECSFLSTINVAASSGLSFFSDLVYGIPLKYLVFKRSNKSDLPYGCSDCVLMRMVGPTQNYF